MNKELIDIANNDLLFVTPRPDIVMSKGEGMYLFDTNQKKYLDFIAGWAVNCLGHSPKVIVDILSKQAAQLLNASPAFYNDVQLNYAKALTNASKMDRVFFASTGAEANESAIKLARKYGKTHLNGAYEIITAEKSFHGRTLSTMAATGKAQFQAFFPPVSPGFKHVPFNDMDAIKSQINDQTVAIMIELIQGEGGVYEASSDYVHQIRSLCDEKGILFIIDEVQTSFGRTGKLFAKDHFDLRPDIMTLGKGIGGGYPLSAMLCTEALNIFESGEQGGTYTAQPLGMAVGHTVLETLTSENLCENAHKMGSYIQSKLTDLSKKYAIKNIRGKGLLIAFDVPDAISVSKTALALGLLVNASSTETIRLVPALILNESHIDEMILILDQSLSAHQ